MRELTDMELDAMSGAMRELTDMELDAVSGGDSGNTHVGVDVNILSFGSFNFNTAQQSNTSIIG
jgi:hypothetical protein